MEHLPASATALPKQPRGFLRTGLAGLLALTLLGGQAWAAISAAMVFEVQTGGSDTNNSGGFRGGAYIGAPTAPTTTGAGTGGTVAAGTYYNVITYTDGLGDTVISGQTGVTVSGATSKITTTSPAASTGALTWNSYFATTSGGPYFPEGTGLTIGSDRVRTTTPPTSGTQPRGVDYSLATTRQLVIDNSAVTATTTGANSNTLTFTGGHTPVGAEVGNIFRATAGTNINAGFYEITAVTTTTWTVAGATNLTTAGGAGSAIVGGMGGALASPGQVAAVAVASNTAYIKAGTYAIGTGTANTAGNRVSLNLAMTWVGYTSNRNPLNTDTPPVLTAGANSQTVFGIQGAHAFASNLSITNPSNFTTVIGFQTIGTSYVRARYINVAGCATSLSLIAGPSLVEDCTSSGGKVVIQGVDSLVRRVSVLSSPGTGIDMTGGSASILEDSVVDSPSGVGIATANECVVRSCAVRNPGGNAGISTPTGAFHVVIENTIVWGASASLAIGIKAAAANAPLPNYLVRNCAVGGSNTADFDPNYAAYQLVGCVTLTGDPWVNASGGNFGLNNTAGAGAACRAAGIPGAFPGLSGTTGYRDIGPAQHAYPAGAGGYRPRPRQSSFASPAPSPRKKAA